MPPDKRILNAQKRSEVHRKEKRAKAQAKLKRRMEVSFIRLIFLFGLQRSGGGGEGLLEEVLSPLFLH